MLNRLLALLFALFISVAPSLAVTQSVTSKLKNNFKVTGTLQVAGATTLSTPLTASNVNNALRRKFIIVPINSGTALADGTTYQSYVPVGEVCTLKAATAITQVVPGGTNTLKILKAGVAGNTMLSAASFNPSTLVADTAQALALTATAADLSLTAGQGIYVQWVAGTQTTAAKAAAVILEVELADY